MMTLCSSPTPDFDTSAPEFICSTSGRTLLPGRPRQEGSTCSPTGRQEEEEDRLPVYYYLQTGRTSFRQEDQGRLEGAFSSDLRSEILKGLERTASEVAVLSRCRSRVTLSFGRRSGTARQNRKSLPWTSEGNPARIVFGSTNAADK